MPRPPKNFMDFIEDCTIEGQKNPPSKVSPTAERFVNELARPGATADSLYAWFQSLPGYGNVTHGDCVRLMNAAHAAQGPRPTEFQPKY
jgi:hypothetical protein